MKINLSPIQENIVKHDNGPILVKAGPGSGKTRVVIERIKRLLLTKKRCKILALTFSNLAADEMKQRILDDPDISDYSENVNVSTIHSFAHDMVQSRGNTIGLNPNIVLFENENDQTTILREVFLNNPVFKDELDKHRKPDNFLKNCLKQISKQKRNFILPEQCNYGTLFPLVYREYNQQLLAQNAMDYDDILFYSYRILTENPGVVKLYTSLYKYICIDEAQDLNFAQYGVIKALCGTDFKNIMLVGDENQSVYGFNGSESSIMAKSFVSDFSPIEYKLSENYRSALNIVNYANILKPHSSITKYAFQGELKAFSFNDESEEALFVLNEINRLKKDGHPEIENKLDFGDFAIIGRNKYVLSSIENLLKTNGLPYFYKKTVSGIENESDFMKVFDMATRLLINPLDIIHFRELCAIVKVKSKGKRGCFNSLQYAFPHPFNFIFDVLSNSKIENIDLLKILEDLSLHIVNIYSEDDRYLIENDINQWKKHWKKYTFLVQKEYRSLLTFRNYVSLGKTQDVSNDNGIALLSAHMSKGLQYNVIFIIGLGEGTFPDYRAINNGDEQLEQEKNNMYVAVTRAMRLCYLTYPKNKMMPWGDYKKQNPSRYLQTLNVKEVVNV